MSALLCTIWPYLLGALIGWLLCGLLARRLKYAEAEEKTVTIEKEKIVEVEKDNPLHLQRIAELEAQVTEIDELKSQLAELDASQASTVGLGLMSAAASIAALEPEVDLPEIDLSAAKAAGFRIKHETDFTVIEGIGPKINDLIHQAGINTFYHLSKTEPNVIQTILVNAGPNFSLARPETWPKQSEYAADNRWQELKVWQDELDGGV